MKKVLVLFLLSATLVGCGRKTSPSALVDEVKFDQDGEVEVPNTEAEQDTDDSYFSEDDYRDEEVDKLDEIDSVSMLGVTFTIPSGYTASMQHEYDVLLTNPTDSSEIQIQLNAYVNNTAKDGKWDEWLFWNTISGDVGVKHKYRAEYYHELNDWQLMFFVSARSEDESCKETVEYIVNSAVGEFDFTPIADLELSEYGTLRY